MTDLPAISEVDDTEAVRVVIFTNGQQVHVPLNTLLQEKGNVVGPASSTDGGFAKFDGLTGQILKDSPAVIAIADGGTGQATAALAFAALKQAATTSATGVVELATDAEALAKADTSRALTPSNLAQFQLVEEWPIIIPVVDNRSWTIILNSAVSRTVTKITTESVSGTCTVTGKINTTALGGAANSASSTEQSQSHTSANVMAVGDNLVITLSANSSCRDLSINIHTTRALLA